jgi:hypothetical protein
LHIQLSRSSIIITNVLADFLLDSFTEFGSSFVRTMGRCSPVVDYYAGITGKAPQVNPGECTAGFTRPT